MNKGGLVTEVAKKTGLSKAEVGRVIDAAIDTVRETVVEGDRVTLADFGTFERKWRSTRDRWRVRGFSPCGSDSA